MKQLTAIAISGGLDSLVAAHLLKEQGHNVIGIHFTTGYETWLTPGIKISHIADQIGISIKTIDCTVKFKKEVVDYFIQTYQAGKTPNPCLVCNRSIKFGTVLAAARRLGASLLATGHYARITRESNGRCHLLKGADPEKDQSYFLAFLTQKQLASACFPLGSMTKSEVARLAVEKGLKPITEKGSQDICFTKGKTYGEFLALQQGFRSKPGPIEDVNGNILGRHKGLHFFTIGQRRGINCPASEPYYVADIDTKQNRLIVGFKKDLLASKYRIVKINWIEQEPVFPIEVYTRIRYRQRAIAATLSLVDSHTAIVRFRYPQLATAPGQGAVFYKGDKVIGGGWIDSVLDF